MAGLVDEWLGSKLLEYSQEHGTRLGEEMSGQRVQVERVSQSCVIHPVGRALAALLPLFLSLFFSFSKILSSQDERQ